MFEHAFDYRSAADLHDPRREDRKNAAAERQPRILEGVTCQARYSDRRMFCPRAIYPFWRESWLERAEPPVVKLPEVD